MRRLPSLKQLEYLVALSETLNFGRAAERCHVTPSTLSAGIRELESVLDVVLAERNNRQVIMTTMGDEIVTRGRALLRDAGDLVDLAAMQAKPLTGPLRIGVIPSVGPFLLPPVLPELTDRYPQLEPQLYELQTQTLLEQVSAGTLDVGVIALPFDTEALSARTLFEDPFLIAFHPSHRFSARKTVDLNALANEPLMLLEEGHCLRDHALDACRSAQKAPREAYAGSSIHTLVHMVAANRGITLVPALALDAHITRGMPIEIRRVRPRATRKIGLVWRPTSLRVSDFQLLGDAICEFIKAKSTYIR